jgi:hypothetical protein
MSSTRNSTAPWVGLPAAAELQLLSHRARPPCTSLPCTPRNCSSSSCCWTRARFGLAASHLHMSEPRASLTRSHFAGSASLLPRLTFRRIPWRRLRYGYRVPASAHARLYVVDLLGHSSTCRARQSRAPTLLLRCARTALPVRPHLPHLRQHAAAPELVRPSPKPLSHRVSNCRSRRALAPLRPTLLLFLLSRRAVTWCRSYPRRPCTGLQLRPQSHSLPRAATTCCRAASTRTSLRFRAPPEPAPLARICSSPGPATACSRALRVHLRAAPLLPGQPSPEPEPLARLRPAPLGLWPRRAPRPASLRSRTCAWEPRSACPHPRARPPLGPPCLGPHAPPPGLGCSPSALHYCELKEERGKAGKEKDTAASEG